MVRLGTVNTATVSLVIPTVREFRASHPATQVELVGAQQSEIRRGLLEGAFDLGLVNHLGGDDMPPGFETTELLHGRPVVCVRPDSPPTALEAVDADSLLAEPLVVMRSGYVMHRFVHRLLGGRAPYSTDGAEMGKLMVAEGLGRPCCPTSVSSGALPQPSAGGPPFAALAAGRDHRTAARRRRDRRASGGAEPSGRSGSPGRPRSARAVRAQRAGARRPFVNRSFVKRPAVQLPGQITVTGCRTTASNR